MQIKQIKIPEIAVVALVGASSSGKSSFAGKHFKPTEILSSDFFRGLVSDDENNQKVTKTAFDALYYVAGKRMDLGLLTVIDATNVNKSARASLLSFAREQNSHACAIVLDMPEKLLLERNRERPDRGYDERVIKNHALQLKKSLGHLEKEGFRYVYVLKSEEEVNAAEIVRVPLWNNKKTETGPFDIIGDVHGCYDELCELLAKSGYSVAPEKHTAVHEEGRKTVFVGDLCDRGPKNMDVLRLVMNMVKAKDAYCVAGNHDVKLLRWLKRSNVQTTHGLDVTLEQLNAEPPDFRTEVREFLESLISHYIFDGGRLAVAHAGIKEKYQGRGSARVKDFCLYGDTSGATDEYGQPVRLLWAEEYRGQAAVVYGHTPTVEATNVNNTFCIDTGCVFGGKLTAFSYPEKKFTQVDAAREYYAPVKPLRETFDIFDTMDDTLDIDDVLGEKFLATRLRRNIKIAAENSAAALEIMSRFGADPHWLIYLPPTMSPCETSRLENYLEYPAEAFNYYKSKGIEKIVCEQKHMGSRGVIIVCKDESAARKRFGGVTGTGIIYTRTGRRFFENEAVETEILSRLRAVLTQSGFWEDFSTDWVCLDSEIMPWSAKAQGLLKEQYACVGRAGRSGLSAAAELIERAASLTEKSADIHNAIDLTGLAQTYRERETSLERYTEAYRRYCWNVESVEDYRIAPFHILAAENKVWSAESHVFHMDTIARYMTGSDAIFMATPYITVDLLSEESAGAAARWWEELTGNGGEGMVVKPYDFIAFKGTELLQPAVKCRGREYLRIIYGPEYTLRENMERLKTRGLSKKRSLALSEFALGMESLERFVRGEPLYRVHECVFGVLALESEPVDPRL